jgi:hypothetical protein
MKKFLFEEVSTEKVTFNFSDLDQYRFFRILEIKKKKKEFLGVLDFATKIIEKGARLSPISRCTIQ